MAENPPPLAIGCRATRCGAVVPAANKRHAFFSPYESGILPGLDGSCEACGASGLVDWERCHARDPGDIEALIESLRLELIRDNYWGLALPEPVMRRARKRTPEQLAASAELNLRQGLRLDHPREGSQTRWATSNSATIIDCARHATATCCRRCLAKWHGLAVNRELSSQELAYLTLLAGTYTEWRLTEAIPAGVLP